MQIRFDDALVVITGASKGIGLACAEAFAAAGARVVGISRSAGNLEAARSQLDARRLALLVQAADLSDPAAALAAIEAIEAAHGPIAVLVNSAGAARRFAPDELDASAIRQGMDAKYFSYMNAIAPTIARMAERGRGAIVNVIGQGGRQANEMHIAGGAANAALMLATVGYARAYAGKGVRVNGINPGLTRTSRVDEGLEASARATGRPKAELLAEQVAKIPMGRMAEPDEVARVAIFLASDAASYVSGAIIPMDGCAAAVI